MPHYHDLFWKHFHVSECFRFSYVMRTNFLKRLQQKEGLSKIVYHMISVTSQPLYTHLKVDLPKPTERNLLGNNWSRWKSEHKAKYNQYELTDKNISIP